jgi:D-arabinose 1-dehydrogenase-like Zn-dependent alcohol dehydrogenase
MDVKGTAALFVGTGQPFELRDFEVPEPEPGAVVVRVLQTNVCGSDLHVWRGETNLERLQQPMPAIIGHEAVGEVLALGAGVVADASGAPLSTGDRITWRYFYPCGQCRSCLKGITRACPQNHKYLSQTRPADEWPYFVGPYATHHYLMPGHVAFRVPEGLPVATASAANCAVAQVIQALTVTQLRPGEAVVIQGVGGLGLYACAVAKAFGAGSVLALDSIPERLHLAREFGADQVLNISEFPEARARVREVRRATDGGGDVVCEFVGHAAAVAEGIGMLAPGGRYLEAGCVYTGTSFDFDPAYLTLFTRSVHGVMCYEPWCLKEALAFLSRARGDHPWEKLSAQPYALRDINTAFAEAGARKVPRAALVME